MSAKFLARKFENLTNSTTEAEKFKIMGGKISKTMRCVEKTPE